MTKEARLKGEAKRGCEWRGHRMGNFRGGGRRNTWDHCFTARCKDCGKHVYVELTPAPNSIDISGEAIALNCPDNSDGY